MFKKSKTILVNGEEAAVGASPPPTMVFECLGFGAVGEGRVLSQKTRCGLGGSDPHAVLVLRLCMYFAWFLSFATQCTLVVLKVTALSSRLI